MVVVSAEYASVGLQFRRLGGCLAFRRAFGCFSARF